MALNENLERLEAIAIRLEEAATSGPIDLRVVESKAAAEIRDVIVDMKLDLRWPHTRPRSVW